MGDRVGDTRPGMSQQQQKQHDIMKTNTINITAAIEAGFTLDEILDASHADRDALFELFPGPTVDIEEA